MSTSLIRIPEQMEVAQKIDSAVSEFMSLPKEISGFQRAFIEASTYSLIKNSLTEKFMEPVKTLCGTKIGFITDKDREPTPYGDDIIKSCVIEAILCGLEVRGNQFNIIQGKMYVTQKGFTSLLKKLTLRYNIDYDIPKTVDGITTVKCKITWEHNGNNGEKIISFHIKVQTGMGNDAILGKADRKAKKWLYLELTDKDLGEGDAVDTEIIVTQSTTNPTPNMPQSEVDRAADWIGKATSIEDLDKKYADIIKKHPSYGKEKYDEIKLKLQTK